MITHQTADPAAVESLRAANPDDSVLLDRGPTTTWLRWLPGRRLPLQVPPGGFTKALYADGQSRPY